jgi:hypothetical protein
MEPNLGTLNLLVGIIAAVSVLEALIFLAIGVAGFILYQRASELLATLEAKHVGPTMVRVNAILDDVKGVTTKVRQETERVDQAIHSTMDRLDDTADRVRSNVRAKTSRIIGFVRGARTVIEHMLNNRPRPQQPAA